MVERRLGRGLDFFLSGSGGDASEPEVGHGERVTEVPIAQLVPSPHQPRREFAPAELEDLARSIRTSGVLQPILVRRIGDRLEIVAGERRSRAAKLAGLERVPAIVREMTDDNAAVVSLVENVHRADLNAIEKARAFRRLQELTKVNQDEIARRVGLDRSTVTNFLRLLDLPDEVQSHVSRGTLTMGHARALLGLANADEQRTVAERAIRGRLSVRQVEAFVQNLARTAPIDPAAPKKAPAGRPVWLNEIEEQLVEAIGAPVRVRYGRKRSQILIECAGREQFEKVYERLKSLQQTDGD
jgi:ParB family chromosome partitioning protein